MAYEKELLSEGQLARFVRSDRVSARVLVEELSHRFNAEAEGGGYESFELDLAQTVPGR
jgi:hypothetical protein